MNMIGHQYIGMNRAFISRRRFAQAFKIECIVGIRKKAGRAIVAALYQMLRNTCQVYPW